MMIGWREVGFEEACELGLEHAARWKWEVFCIELFGFGLTICARASERG